MPKSSSLILEKFEIFNLGRISQFGPILNSKMHPEPPSYINSVHNLSVAISLNSFFQNMGRPTFSYFCSSGSCEKVCSHHFLDFYWCVYAVFSATKKHTQCQETLQNFNFESNFDDSTT